jgi:hypothetical protein
LEKGVTMALVARILGCSLFAAALGAALAFALFGRGPERDYLVIVIFIACFGAIIGAIAGAAREIVTALRQRP